MTEYKETNVGAIPVDWERVSVGDLMRLQNGVNADGDAYGTGTPFVNVLEVITNSHLYYSEIPGKVELPHAVLRNYTVETGDVLFNRTSETQEEVGLASVYLGDESVVFGGFVIRGQLQSGKLDTKYAGYALRSTAVRTQIISRAQGAVRANIGQDQLSRVSIPLPPLPEQRAIAEVLSDVDALIEKLDALIEKKRAVKTATMQRLLTGEQRLPGFDGDWATKRLGEVTQVVNGGTPSSSVHAYWGGEIPWCTPTDITSTSSRFLSETERNITEKGLANSSATLLPKGSLLLCSRATVGEVRIAAMPITTNQGFKSLVCDSDTSNKYLYYLLLTMKSDLEEVSSGSTFLELSKRSAAALEITLPPLNEQQAIATILSDMDAEIEALEARRNKMQDIRQGMMQELLTGRTRLV